MTGQWPCAKANSVIMVIPKDNNAGLVKTGFRRPGPRSFMVISVSYSQFVSHTVVSGIR